MGNYRTWKTNIERGMAERVDVLTKRFRADMEAADAYIPSERYKRREELIQAYNESIDREHERAINDERSLFDNLRRDVERALGKTPTESQLSYLQMLSLKADLTSADIEAAVSVVSGNSLARATLCSLARNHGIELTNASLELGEQPSLAQIINGLNEYQESRARSINAYGRADRNGNLDEWHGILFAPDASSNAFDKAEQVISDYGEAA